MFDNPNEELQKLEQQLLAAEEKGDDFESFYQDILSEFGPESQKQAPRQSAPAASAMPAARCWVRDTRTTSPWMTRKKRPCRWS